MQEYSEKKEISYLQSRTRCLNNGCRFKIIYEIKDIYEIE